MGLAAHVQLFVMPAAAEPTMSGTTKVVGCPSLISILSKRSMSGPARSQEGSRNQGIAQSNGACWPRMILFPLGQRQIIILLVCFSRWDILACLKRTTETASKMHALSRMWTVPTPPIAVLMSLRNASNSIGFFGDVIWPGAITPKAATALCSTLNGTPTCFVHHFILLNKLSATVGFPSECCWRKKALSSLLVS